MTQSTFNRRGFLKGPPQPRPWCRYLAAGGGGGDSDTGSTAKAGAKSDANPFGIKEDGKLDAVIFNGGYGIAYCEFAAQQMKKKYPKLTTSVKASNNISPRSCSPASSAATRPTSSTTRAPTRSASPDRRPARHRRRHPRGQELRGQEDQRHPTPASRRVAPTPTSSSSSTTS